MCFVHKSSWVSGVAGEVAHPTKLPLSAAGLLTFVLHSSGSGAIPVAQLLPRRCIKLQSGKLILG